MQNRKIDIGTVSLLYLIAVFLFDAQTKVRLDFFLGGVIEI